MKIKLTTKNVSYKAALTPMLKIEIQQVDALEISNKLTKNNIQNDLRNNKVVAWCCDKTIQILQQINKKYGQKLPLPKGIYVEDFNNLDVEDPLIIGTCNLRPSRLRKNSTDRIPSRTIFFNSIHDWENIDSISDSQYAAKNFSTDFFLYPFLHEFVHVIHENYLLDKFGGEKLAQILEKANEADTLKAFRDKYGKTVSQICTYASNTPLDTIACDISKRIADSVDKETLMPTQNPFASTPYGKIPFWRKTPKYNGPNDSLNEILRNFWNGKFE